MEISVVRKDECKLIRTVCKLVCVVFAVAMIVMLFSKAVSADATLEKSGEDEYFRYELYSDGELKITFNYSDYNSYYFYLSHIGDDALSKVKTVTVDLAGYEDGYIYLSGYDSDTTGITGIKFIDLHEDVEIEYLLINNFTSVDSFDFLSDVRINELAIGNGFQNADLSDANVKYPNIYGEDLTSVILPDVCESAYFRGCEKLKKCYIPAGLKYVWAWGYSSTYGNGYNYCFEECDSLTDVYYAGSKSEFEEIKILLGGEGGTGKVAKNMNISDLLTGVNIHYYNGITSAWYQKSDDSWVYIDQNGESVTGWQQIGGSWYYFDESGIMSTDWKQIGGAWYYFGNNGKMVSGWQKLSDNWYYFGDNGSMRTGWQKVNNSWYYFGENGSMRTDWQKIGNDWYYFGTNGIMISGWQKMYNNWYYFDNGVMAKNWKQISGKWYYFGDSGIMRTGWLLQNGNWYYLDASGAMSVGWKQSGSSWYYFNGSGVMQKGWLKLDGKWYYLDPSSGSMTTGTRIIDGKTYNFNSSGVCTNP